MKSKIKHFSFGWALGIFLGLVCAGAFVYAGGITSRYNTGDTLHATDMNAILDNLNGKGSCPGNFDVPGDAMVRVGSICVDTNLARIDFTGCALDGTTGCTAVPTSTAAGTAATAMSWAQAARACANAGKRLLTPGEWLTAKSLGILNDITDGNAEWVDLLVTTGTNNTGSGSTAPVQGTYIGPNLASAGSGVAQMFSNVAYNADNSGNTFISFRCAR